MSNRNRTVRLDLCRKFLNARAPADPPAGLLTEQQERADERRCPMCQIGTLRIVEYVPSEDLLILSKGNPPVYQIDSS